MKSLLIKYLYLSYTVVLFGHIGKLPRAATVIMPVICMAIATDYFLDMGLLFWAIFTVLILLTFPIIKNKYINIFAAAITLLLMINSLVTGDYPIWEPLPFAYFALGLLVKKTRFIFPLKYKDIEDWEQQLQYLSYPREFRASDDTAPVAFQAMKDRRYLLEDYENKYEGRAFVNVDKFLIPLVAMIVLVILFIFFGSSSAGYTSRGF
jgi:hypothetical protein